LAFYLAGCNGHSVTSYPSSPWSNNKQVDGSGNFNRVLSRWTNPASGSALSARWATADNLGTVASAGAVIKSAGGAPSTLTVTNPGTVPVEAMTIDILGPLYFPYIVNQTNGLTLGFGGFVSSTKHLIVNTGTATATNDGLSVVGLISHSGDTPFMRLDPGPNVLAIYGGSATGSTLVSASFVVPYE
jgi:hypothetical protein